MIFTSFDKNICWCESTSSLGIELKREASVVLLYILQNFYFSTLQIYVEAELSYRSFRTLI
jgi:hypothetical protein